MFNLFKYNVKLPRNDSMCAIIYLTNDGALEPVLMFQRI